MWDKFIEGGYIKPIDLELATHLMGKNPPSKEIEAFLIHLSVSIRRGHVCIHKGMDVRSVWELTEPVFTDAKDIQIGDDEWENVSQLVCEGFDTLPSHLYQKPDGSSPLNLNPIVISGSMIYTQRSFLAESQFKQHLEVFLSGSQTPASEITKDDIQAKIDSHGLEGLLLKEQKEALLSLSAPLSIIAGGPGTGKTYTAGWMISILSEILKEKLGRPISVALAAPTGKAALHLEKSVSKGGASAAKYTGVTLHALLSQLPVQADLIVVDEASMIDLEWMSKLLKHTPKGARLILIGDPDQLPPVGMGSIFVDMVNTMPHTHLKQCMRTDLKEILEYANGVKNGVYTTWEPCYPLNDESMIIERAIKEYKNCLSWEDFSRFKILTPFTKGPFGTEQLNQKILKGLEAPTAIPILITKNDYELELFNGEQGLWFPKNNRVQFPKKGDGGIREVPLSLIGAYQLGYCLTIHKSQGSEYAHVAALFPEGAQIFGREALYTAVTRAKQKLEIYAAPQVLEQTIQRNTRRLSGITSD